MLDDKTTYAPFHLWEFAPGHHMLSLSDTDMVNVMDTFDANGRYGNGYAWSDVALGVIRARFPVLEDLATMDPEAGTFSVACEDLEALKLLAEVLHDGFHNLDRLGPLVAAAPWEYD